jgi:UrcA family protein
MSFVNVRNSATHATRARRALISAVGVTLLSLGSATVCAASPLPQKEVSLADLDLSLAADTNKAYGRLAAAAKVVCRQIDIAEPRGMRSRNQCFKVALANAVNTVNNEQLTRLHQSDRSVRLAQRISNRTSNNT